MSQRELVKKRRGKVHVQDKEMTHVTVPLTPIRKNLGAPVVLLPVLNTLRLALF